MQFFSFPFQAPQGSTLLVMQWNSLFCLSFPRWGLKRRGAMSLQGLFKHHDSLFIGVAASSYRMTSKLVDQEFNWDSEGISSSGFHQSEYHIIVHDTLWGGCLETTSRCHQASKEWCMPSTFQLVCGLSITFMIWLISFAVLGIKSCSCCNV